jgi:uncharacterized protein (TIGR04255 family)
MSKKMKNAPVYFTVVQVRFNPVLNMEGYLPTIQERMRSMHFPDFRRESIQQLVIPFAAAGETSQPPTPSFAPQARCIFGTIDAKTEFVLENNAIALQTTAYNTSETFFKMLLDGLTIIHDALHLDFTERIGLRYFDAVLPKSDESLSDYLTPEVMGLSNKLGEKLLHSFCETVTVNTSGKLVSRIIIQDGRVGLPPDIFQLAPKIDPKFTGSEGRHAILDTDAFFEQREVFDLEKIGSRLNALHAEITTSFKATVTPHALKVWE